MYITKGNKEYSWDIKALKEILNIKACTLLLNISMEVKEYY
jgi:hypothetical protein